MPRTGRLIIGLNSSVNEEVARYAGNYCICIVTRAGIYGEI